MNDAMRPLGLTAAQADALVVIGQAGPLSLKDLGELLIAEAGHPSRLVDRLVDAGLVERRPAGTIAVASSSRSRDAAAASRSASSDARDEVLQLARELIGDRDLGPALEVIRELVQFTPYADLIARRGELLDRAASD